VQKVRQPSDGARPWQAGTPQSTAANWQASLHSSQGVAYPALVGKAATESGVVIQLAKLRAQRRLLAYQKRISQALESNRRSIGRLYTTGLIFSAEGSCAGRDLLLAHQHLLKVLALLNRLRSSGPGADPTSAEDAYRELDSLLEKTGELTHRTGHYLSRLRRE